MNPANATLMNHTNATLMNPANATLINYDKGYHNETALVIAFIFIIVCCYWYNAPSKEESKRRFHFGVERAKKRFLSCFLNLCDLGYSLKILYTLIAIELR